MRRWAFGIGVVVGMFLSWSFYDSPAIAEAPTYPIENENTVSLDEYLYVKRQLDAAIEWVDVIEQRQRDADEARLTSMLADVPIEAHEAIMAMSAKYDVPMQIIVAVGEQESRWDTDAVGDAGEIGAMQVMPATAALIADAIGREIDLYDVSDNIEAAAWYLRWCADYEATWDRALACYNGGPGAWDYKPITRAYAAEVLARTVR